jgi:hypothetical protein
LQLQRLHSRMSLDAAALGTVGFVPGG